MIWRERGRGHQIEKNLKQKKKKQKKKKKLGTVV